MTRMPGLVALSMGCAALVGGCAKPSRTAAEANHGIARVDSAQIRSPRPQNPVHTIALPHDEPLLPPGPGREEFVTACVVCHSPRYITMQPRFTRSAWLGLVKKMKDSYGAHITDQEVAPITDYLVFLDGKSEDVRTSPADVHGSDIHGSATYGE